MTLPQPEVVSRATTAKASLTQINLHAPTGVFRRQPRGGIGHKFKPGFSRLVGHSLAFGPKSVSMIS